VDWVRKELKALLAVKDHPVAKGLLVFKVPREIKGFKADLVLKVALVVKGVKVD
jgi:hypothetical protein